MSINENDLAKVTRRLLATLSPRKELILRLKFGIDVGGSLNNSQIAEQLGLSAKYIENLEQEALRDLRRPTITPHFNNGFSLAFDHESIKDFGPRQVSSEVIETIEQVKKLTPDLVRHLQHKTDDLSKLNEYLFEEIVAELLAQQGYENVKLVGRNPNTSADIFAIQSIKPSGVKVRLFVEVKKWKKKVGIAVINSVYGAMMIEQPIFGCNAAMIVSIEGFTKTQKISANALEMRGIYLKDKTDLTKWLNGYIPNKNGLWLLPGNA